jgi:hypothetical protein
LPFRAWVVEESMDANVSAIVARPVAGPIIVDARKIVRFLWLWWTLIVVEGAAYAIAVAEGVDLKRWTPFVRLVDLNDELTIPSWYSATLMATAALLLFAHAAIARRDDRPAARRWFFLGVIFIYMSLDETSQIHELGNYVQLLHPFTGALAYAWVVIAIPVVVVLGLFFLPFVLRLPSHFRNRVLVAGFVYVGGALGMEMVQAFIATHGYPPLAWATESIIEEGGEIAGLTLFVRALLLALAAGPPILVGWRSERPNSSPASEPAPSGSP